LFGKPSQRFGSRRQVGLFSTPIIEAFKEFLVDANIDLWILRHWYIAINLVG